MCRRMHHMVHDTPVLWDACEIQVEAGHTGYFCGLRSRAFRLLFIYTPPQGPRMYLVRFPLFLSQWDSAPALQMVPRV